MSLRLRDRTFPDRRTLVMAIVNRTPDSFFDRGATFTDPEAMAAVDRAVSDGADIVDVGGVKAGPGSDVDVREELRRTVGFVANVRDRHPGLLVSVDTWRHEVGDAVCRAGADLLNDAWGGFDPELAHVAGQHGVGLVCTHTAGATPRSRPHRVAYDDVVGDAVAFLAAEAERAVAAGVPADSVLVDPGHDFGKSTRHSLAVTARLDAVVATGWPTLVSLSNKDFVGETLDRPLGDRLVGTLAATAVCAWLGARVFRAHQVAETRQTLDMVASIAGARPPAVARRGLA